MIRHYILNDQGEPVPCQELLEWASWFLSNESRFLYKDRIGRTTVSTIFLGLDHNWRPEGPPILWETMVFGGKMDQAQTRCSGSSEQAQAMHAEMVRQVKEAQSTKRSYDKKPKVHGKTKNDHDWMRSKSRPRL